MQCKPSRIVTLTVIKYNFELFAVNITRTVLNCTNDVHNSDFSRFESTNFQRYNAYQG